MKRAAELQTKLGNPQKLPDFYSPHWNEPNIISHIRMNERIYQGKKVAFMEELQSDWAREGRAKGFSNPEMQNTLQKRLDELPLEMGNAVRNKNFKLHKKLKVEREQVEKALSGVPNNPLLKNWQELSIKRALKDAVDSNAEYFSWINGEQTSARYNLATYLDDVNWKKSISPIKNKGDKSIVINPKDSKGSWLIDINKEGKITTTAGGASAEMRGKKLDEVLGKGLADKIMAKEKGTLSGEGLKFGGEWANNLYDKQVGNIVSDLTGAKVEKLDMKLPISADTEKMGIWVDANKVKAGESIADTVKRAKLEPKDLKVGMTVNRSQYGAKVDNWVITDILGEGKFKAVPKKIQSQRLGELEVGKDIKLNDPTLERDKQIFDIFTKKTTQQGIKLTPEIKAKIRDEVPTLKQPSGISPFGKAQIAPVVGIGTGTTGVLATLAALKKKNQQQEGKNYAEKIASIKIPKNNIDVTWEVAMRQGKDKRWRIENIPKNTGSMGSVNVDRLFEGNTVNINANNIKDLFSIYKVRPEKQKEYGGKLKSIGNIDLETNPYATRPTYIQEIKEIYNQVKDYSYKDMQKEFERLGSPLQYISGQISDSLIKYGITPGEFIAVVRKDSGAGTSGSARITKTPGNVGAYDNKVPMKFATWIEGSVATIRNLAERKV